MNRRRFIASTGLVGLSGCLRLQNNGGDETETNSPVTRRSPTQTATATVVESEPTTVTEQETVTEEETVAETETTETETQSGSETVRGSWSQFAADAANTGYAPEETGPTDGIEERWRFDTGDLVASSPVIEEGQVIFTGFKEPGHIWAVDANNGTQLWQQQVAGVDHIGAPAIKGDRVYVPTWNRADGENRLYAINAASGSFVWEYQLRGGAFGSPTVKGDTVYVGDGPKTGEENGDVVAIDLSDGTERWRKAVTGVPLGTVAMADGNIYATSLVPSDFTTYPSDPQSSAEGFHPKRFFVFGNLDEEPHASVAEMDAAGGYVTVIDADSVTQRWESELPDFVVTGAVIVDDTVIVGCWDHNVYALASGSGEQRWSHDTNAPISSQPSVADGTVYVGNWDGNLYAISLSDGQRQWFYPFDNKVTSSPAITNDRVYVAVDNRGVFGLSTGGRLDFEYEGPIGDYNASSPAVADGGLVVCGDIAKIDDESERGGPFLLK